MSIVMISILTLLCALAYRLGGLGKDGAAQYHLPVWLCSRYMRRIGVPIISLIILLLLQLPHGLPWWAYLLIFGLQFGAVSTYFKFGGQEDVLWYNWLLTGIACGLVMLPAAILTGAWIGFVIRLVVITAGIVLVSLGSKNAWVEECGRGAFIAGTIPLLLVGA